MLIDARCLPTDALIEADICIVGAGPAGITVARELIGQNFRVCLLESGTLEANEDTQSLCAGETVGDPFGALGNTRCRRFGGAANLWNIPIRDHQRGLKYMPLDEIDFQKRECIPYSGWPFSKSDLNPFYERAHSVCKIGPFAYQAEEWEEAQSPQLPFKGDRIATSMIQFGSSAVFTQEYRTEIEESSNITTYLNANVVDIETDETATNVTRLRVACLQGNKFWVAAKTFVLATGGIENARLLLLANKTQKTGLGNQNDLVGRFFMEHPIFCWGRLIPTSQELFNSTNLYDLRLVKDVPVRGKLTLTQAQLHRKQLLNFYALLRPRGKGENKKALSSLKLLLASVRRAETNQMFKHLTTVITEIDEIAATVYRQKRSSATPSWGWSHLQKKDQKFTYFEVPVKSEQVPDPDNRVTLSHHCDRLGLRKAKLHWRWSDTDIRNNQQAQAILAAEFARSGIGQLQIEPIGEGLQRDCGKSDHHIGTTRMHHDPKQGVVDENCRVHGTSNLFIAGSSVFPTGGCANPTLTIIALAIRLADHLNQDLKRCLPVEIQQHPHP